MSDRRAAPEGDEPDDDGKGLAEDYREAGFGGRIGIGRRPALIVVDLVRAYLDPGSSLYARAEHVVPKVVRLAQDARRLGHPVVFSYVSYAPGGADGGWFYRKVPALRLFDAGSPWALPPPELAPLPGDLTITKRYPSAFSGTTLAATLTALGVDSAVITGVSTSGCVRATAVDALSQGLRPIVVRDAVADRDPRPHEAALFDLGAKYADLYDAAEIPGLWKAPA